jgi:multidrug efflux pump
LALTSPADRAISQIAPPQVNISATYPGADAQTVENSVTQVIEQQHDRPGQSRLHDGDQRPRPAASITLTFTTAAPTRHRPGAGAEQAAAGRAAQLPQVVQQQRHVRLQVLDRLPDGHRLRLDRRPTNSTDLADYVDATVNDPLSRVEGVGSTQLFGGNMPCASGSIPDSSCQIRPDAERRGAAIEAQNAQVSAGQLGGLPARKGQQLNATVTAQSRLQTAEQFRNIILKSQTDGSLVHLNDVATCRARRRKLYDFKPTTTASPPPASPSTWRPAPTPSTPPRRCARRSPA